MNLTTKNTPTVVTFPESFSIKTNDQVMLAKDGMSDGSGRNGSQAGGDKTARVLQIKGVRG